MTVKCFPGGEPIDPDDPKVWRATSVWSRSDGDTRKRALLGQTAFV
jgi:hypothetical protein